MVRDGDMWCHVVTCGAMWCNMSRGEALRIGESWRGLGVNVLLVICVWWCGGVGVWGGVVVWWCCGGGCVVLWVWCSGDLLVQPEIPRDDGIQVNNTPTTTTTLFIACVCV